MHILLLSALTTLASAIQYSDVGMLCLVNNERQRHGLKPLGLDPRLDKAAVKHSKDQASMGQMSHTGSDGSSPSQRIQDCGVNWLDAGENVAYGYHSMKEVMNQWMESPGHRANILGKQYTMFGSGIASHGNTVYFTQDFANDGQGTRNVPRCDGSDYEGSMPSSRSPRYAPSNFGDDNAGNNGKRRNHNGRRHGGKQMISYGGNMGSSNQGRGGQYELSLGGRGNQYGSSQQGYDNFASSRDNYGSSNNGRGGHGSSNAGRRGRKEDCGSKQGGGYGGSSNQGRGDHRSAY